MQPVHAKREFPDGSDYMHQPNELRSLAARHGIVRLRNVVDTTRIDLVRNAIYRLCEAQEWIERHDGDYAIPRTVLPREGSDGSWLPFYRAVQSLRTFHELAHSPRLVAAMQSILNDRVFIHPRNILRLVAPQDHVYTTPPHQDFWYIKGTPNTWTAWIPLLSMRPALGGLAAQPGSHHLGVLPMRPGMGPGGFEVDSDHTEDWAWDSLEKGDALVFHSLTVHQGVDNRDQFIRLSMDARYQSIHEPMDEDSLIPHYHIAHWEELYETWPKNDPLKYYWKEVTERKLPDTPPAFSVR